MKRLGKSVLVGTLAGSALGWIALGCTEVVDASQVASAPSSEESVASSAAALSYTQDFFDGFDGGYLDTNNWVAQDPWVNAESQCYDNNYNGGTDLKTVEVSGTSLKVRVIDRGAWVTCNNKDKSNVQFKWNGDPNNHTTPYVAGRIAGKSKKEFMGGKWTARIKFSTKKTDGSPGQASGLAGQFPAWWTLGARNNEVPITNAGYQNVCWPKRGSGEVDILEHYGSGGANRFAARGIKLNGGCDLGDWQTYQLTISSGVDLANFHEYQAEYLTGGDIVYRIDGVEKGRTYGAGYDYPEPMFGILNYALSPNSYMNPGGVTYKSYTMEVDWAKHESVSGGCGITNNVGINAYNGYNYASAATNDVLTATAGTVQGWEQYDIVDAGGGFVGLRSHKNNLYVQVNNNDANKPLQAKGASIGAWEKFQFISAGGGYYSLKASVNNMYVKADSGAGYTLRANSGAVGDWEKFSCVRY